MVKQGCLWLASDIPPAEQVASWPECCAACTKARGRGCAKWVFRGPEEGGFHLHTANATAEKASVVFGEMAPQPQ